MGREWTDVNRGKQGVTVGKIEKIYNLKGSPESRRHEGAIWPIEQVGEGIEMGQQTGLRRDRRPA